jgi:hypothetical protein
MSFSNTTVLQTYAGNGATTSFSITQTISDNSQVVVYLKSATSVYTLQTLTTHYTLTGSPATAVVFVTAPASGVTVVIVRVSALTQLTDYLNTGPFLAETHEAALDKVVMLLQELDKKSLKIPVYDTGSSVLPERVGSQVLGTDASGNWAWYAPSVAGVVTGVVPIANGGTNSTATPTAGGAAYGTGTANAYTAVGTSGQYLKSNGSSAPSWTTFTSPTIQKFTSGSGTYTTPANVKYIRVRAVGSGAGGGGGGANDGATGSAGNNTTFGSSLLVANGGGATGSGATPTPGAGGTASLGTGPIGTAVTGGSGSYGSWGASSLLVAGGLGGSSLFGGPGASGGGNQVAAANSSAYGSGGSGGGTTTAANAKCGAGGGAGGGIDAIIAEPSATYSYSVGAAGAGGAAGTNGAAGGNGGAGYIEVTEYYQ